METLAISPINVKHFTHFASFYPDQRSAADLVEGVTRGFRLHYQGPRTKTDCINLKSVVENPVEAYKHIKQEIIAGRVVGPFDAIPIYNLRVSPIGLVPKKDGSWRMIHHLSYPKGNSVNDFIDPQLCTVQYSSIDSVMDMIANMSPGVLLGKMDISNAFRLIRIHPSDFELLGFKLLGKYFVDKALPMGCALACSLFEQFATFLEWVVKVKSGKDSISHYLDDFIFAGSSESNACQVLMACFTEVCSELGIPIAERKTVGPSPVMVFLGLELDTIQLQVRIPQEKLLKLKSVLLSLMKKKKATLKEFQSLLGLLNFCSRAIPSARAFNRRFYDAIIGLTKPLHHLRITKSIKEDIRVWLFFLDYFNGYCSFPERVWSFDNQLHLYTDSAGSSQLGCAAYFQPHWIHFLWPQQWVGLEIMRDITFLELVPIVMAFHVWAGSLRSKKIVLHIDNQALVIILNKKSSKSKRIMFLLRDLVLHAMLNDIQLKAVHVAGVSNGIADSLSRLQWVRFRRLAPMADRLPTLVPQSFRQLISNRNLTVC